LLREKIVAQASKEMIVIADHTKVVDTLGAFALPIEVVPFGLSSTELAIRALANALELVGALKLRQNADDSTFITDGGHFILDASFSRISDAKRLSEDLNKIPGVVENGLFIGMASKAVVATLNGVEIIEKD
jgi:ribose 5-phosphate isomerase A